MGEFFKDKTASEMVEDRDRALAAKEKEIAGLNDQIKSLEVELANAWKHPLSNDEKLAKKRMTDWQSAHEMLCKDQDSPETASVHVMALGVIRDRDEALGSLDVATGIVNETLDAAKTIGQLIKVVERLRG